MIIFFHHNYNGIDTRLTASFIQDNVDKPVPERLTKLDFNEERDDGVAMASAGLYANHLHLAPDRYHVYASTHHAIFTGHILFLTSNRQCRNIMTTITTFY